MRTQGAEAWLRIALNPVAPKDFAPRPSAAAALRNLPDPADLPPPATATGLAVTLDPGHGGFDPGAQAGPDTEAALVLTFAQELRTALEARGVTVTMTRDSDEFVASETGGLDDVGAAAGIPPASSRCMPMRCRRGRRRGPRSMSGTVRPTRGRASS